MGIFQNLGSQVRNKPEDEERITVLESGKGKNWENSFCNALEENIWIQRNTVMYRIILPPYPTLGQLPLGHRICLMEEGLVSGHP